MRPHDRDELLADEPTHAVRVADGARSPASGSDSGGERPAGKHLSTGARIAHRYRIVRLLGSGAMGEVYEAIDEQDGARIAIKTLPRIEGEALLLFKNEFRALADVQHPGIVSLGELASDHGLWFLTMELVRGTDWVEYARSGGERTLRTALAGLGEAVAALHALGRVHRDLKPSNVLVEPDGRVVLLDFGLVHDANALDSAAQDDDDEIRGTPAYMAPEQASGRATDAAVDRYAIGVMLYKALAGRVPFAGTFAQMLRRKQTEVPEPPSTYADGIPLDLERLCLALLSTDPQARPTAEAIVEVARGKDAAESGTYDLGVPRRVHGGTFVGRTKELAFLRRAFEDSRKGPVSVVIEGESGLGKSALARRFAESIRDSGAIVLSSRCLDRENIPFKVLDGAIDMLARRLDRMRPAEARVFAPRARTRGALLETFPVLKSVEPFAVGGAPVGAADVAEQRQRAFEALRELVERLAAEHPVVFVVDDLQWADKDSDVALQEMLRPNDGPPALFLFTSRGEGSRRLLAAAPGADVRPLELSPLSDEAAASLAAWLGCNDEVARGIAAEAAGHPMLISELARVSGPEATPSDTRGLTLDEAIVRRLDLLPESVRDLVSIASLAGVPLPSAIAFDALGLEPAEGRRALAAGREVALLRIADTGGEAIEPYHDRVRESVGARLDPSRAKELHTALAASIERSELATRRPDVLATHLLGAGRTAEARVAFIDAARRAVAAAGYDAAVEAYERALALPSSDEDASASLLEELGHALQHAGRVVDASKRLVEAANRGPADARARRARDAGVILLDAGELERAQTILAPGLASHGERWPTVGPLFYLRLVGLAIWAVVWSRFARRDRRFPEEGRADSRAAELAMHLFDLAIRVTLIDFVVGAWFALRALRVAVRSRDIVAIGKATSMFGALVAGSRRDVEAWRELTERCRAKRKADDLELDIAGPMLDFVTAYFGERDEASVLPAMERIEAMASAAPGRFHVQMRLVRSLLCWAGLNRGDLSSYASSRSQARESVRRRNPMDSMLLGTWACPVFLADGSLGEASRIGEGVRRDIPMTDRQPLRDLLGLRFDAMVDYARGASLAWVLPRLRAQLRSVVRGFLVAPEVWCQIATHGIVAAERNGESVKPWIELASHIAVVGDPEEQPRTASYVGMFESRIVLATRGRDAAIAALRKLAEEEARHGLVGRRLLTMHSLGRLLGGEEGARLEREAEAEWRALGVRDPRGFCSILAPLPGDPAHGDAGRTRTSSP